MRKSSIEQSRAFGPVGTNKESSSDESLGLFVEEPQCQNSINIQPLNLGPYASEATCGEAAYSWWEKNILVGQGSSMPMYWYMHTKLPSQCPSGFTYCKGKSNHKIRPNELFCDRNSDCIGDDFCDNGITGKEDCIRTIANADSPRYCYLARTDLIDGSKPEKRACIHEGAVLRVVTAKLSKSPSFTCYDHDRCRQECRQALVTIWISLRPMKS